MKVLILSDHPQLGRGGQVVEVADGYAKNYLIPRKLVIAATEQNLRMWRTRLGKMEKERARLKSKMEELAQKLGTVSLILRHKTGEGGKLFGAVTSADVAEALKSQAAIEIDRKKIILEEPIKFLGTFQVPVKLEMEVKAQINLIIEKSDE
jgi:large subunit ribosomal protein L9